MVDIHKLDRPLTVKFINGVTHTIMPNEKGKYSCPDVPFKQNMNFDINSVEPIIPWYHYLCNFPILDNEEYPLFMRYIINHSVATHDGIKEFMFWFGLTLSAIRYLKDPQFRLQTDGCVFKFINGMYDGAYLSGATCEYKGIQKKYAKLNI